MAQYKSVEKLKNDRIRRILLVIFLSSGATSLVYETLWSRQLHLVFGVSQIAIATLLAGFMAGLAIGGFIAAKWASRIKKPLIVYAALEAFIGLYALVFPFILELSTPIYLSFYRAFEPTPLVFGVFQFFLQGLLLLPPTISMGATLPVLSRFVTRDTEEAGVQISRLYGANTIGAVIGTGLAGFFLLPRFGLSTTTVYAAAANGLLALAAILLSRSTVPLTLEPEKEFEQAEEFDQVHRYLWIIAAMAGFAALLSEVAWFRLIGLLIGGSVYSFSVMLLAFLLGIGIGGWAVGSSADKAFREGGRGMVLKRLAFFQVAVASLSYLAMWVYGELPFIFTQLFTLVEDNLDLLWPAKLLLAVFIMFPPAFFMGATFPYLVRAAAGNPDKLNQPVGRLYGMNTLGAIFGASLGGLFLLPLLRVQGSVLFAGSINLLAAALAFASSLIDREDVKRSARFRLVGVTLTIILLFQVARPPWEPLLMTSGVYQYVSGMKIEERTRQGVIDYNVKPYKLLYYEEGLSTVVTVAKKPNSDNIWMANNGKIDASSHVDFDTQVLISHIPLAMKPAPKKVLMVGYASGISVGAITTHDRVGEIDVVELEPAIIRAAEYFIEHNNDALNDPRVNLFINDGRNHLTLARDDYYDLIISEPPNPWLSGVSNLFTDEFWTLGKSKLKSDGVWSQWVQMYAMEPEDVQSLLKTFAQHYNHVALFRLNLNDLLMVGSDEPLALDIENFQTLFNEDDIAQQMYRSNLDNGADVLGLYAFGQDQIFELAGDIDINTDDNMRIEYSAPLNLHASTRGPNNLMLSEAMQIPWSAIHSEDDVIALGEAYAYYDYLWDRTLELMELAVEQYPENQTIREMYADYLENAN
ncbi:MAG: fused MFS/spermidine synthase [Chloroflexota bacterium]